MLKLEADLFHANISFVLSVFLSGRLTQTRVRSVNLSSDVFPSWKLEQVLCYRKRESERSLKKMSMSSNLDLSIDDITKLRDSIRSKYKREVFSRIHQTDSSDEDFSDFIVPDHLDSDGEMDGNILNRNELIEDSFISEHSSSVTKLPTVVDAQNGRIVSEYFIRNDQTRDVSSKLVIRQTGKRGKKTNTTEFDQKILENLRKYGNTGWISK